MIIKKNIKNFICLKINLILLQYLKWIILLLEVDDEPAIVKLMEEYAKDNGYKIDISDTRYHHEIYLSDPRKCDVNKLKTVIRHPIKKVWE